ncbi:MAG: hypothetical protein RIM99_19325 [Cyclobacteriaceae bacterium]
MLTNSCSNSAELEIFCDCIGEPSTSSLLKLRTNYEEFLTLNYQTTDFETGTEKFIQDLLSDSNIEIDSVSFNKVMTELRNSGFLDEFEIYEYWNDIENKMVQTAGLHKHDGKYAECLKLVENPDITAFIEVKEITMETHWDTMIPAFKDYEHQDNELAQLIFILESYRTYMLDRTLYNKR